MYTEFFGLSEKPFSITPDPRYLYLSLRHADALAHLIYGISESGGFIQLTGEVGTGKTTLIRTVLEQLPEKAEIALILNPQLSAKEFLQAICDELGTKPPADDTLKARIDSLNAYLLEAHAAGRRVVLIVDEAQTLDAELLEQVRLLTNLETPKQKLLQIILIGQPELRELLGRPEMRQVAQRITGRYHLEPLRREETIAYVRHRMSIAGSATDVFKPSAIRVIYRRSRGIPRLVNVVADRALLAAYSADRRQVDSRLVRRAAAEVFGERRPGGRWWPWLGASVALTSFALATTNLWQPGAGPSVLDAYTERVAASMAGLLPRGQRPSADIGRDAVAKQREAKVDDNAALHLPQDPGPDGAGATADGDKAAAARGAIELGVQPSAELTVDELVHRDGFAGDADSAVGELLALWGGTYDARRGEACAQAAEQGLRCLAQTRGSLGELRRINWPVVLALSDDAGAAHHLAVTQLAYDRAVVRTGGNDLEIPIPELSYHWYGDFLLVWRPPTPDTRDMSLGSEGDGVLWLRTALALLEGSPPLLGESPIYDVALEQRVRAYQRTRALTVDGIAGARTQIALLAQLGLSGAPSLMAGR